jgi:hypothetical protein
LTDIKEGRLAWSDIRAAENNVTMDEYFQNPNCSNYQQGLVFEVSR